MTCIVGVVDKGAVIIGGDSAGVSTGNLSLVVRNDKKVFRSGDFVMGFTTSFRMGQLLAYNFHPPKPRQGIDPMEYMVTDFIDATRARMKEGGFRRVKEEQEEGGTFLVGYAGRLFQINGDFQVGESTHGFDAVGCGELIALGSLYSSSGVGSLAAFDRVIGALKAAEAFSAGVRGPFTTEVLPAPAGVGAR